MSDAHELAPCTLIASPKLDGGPFERALVTIVHHDREGAMGFIANKPLELDLGTLLDSAQQAIEHKVDPGCFDKGVYFGGPVRSEQLWLMYRQERAEEPDSAGALQVGTSWRVIADAQQIESFIAGRRLEAYRPYIGYAGWGAGQLEREIEEGSWLLGEFNPEELVLREQAEDGQAWRQALAALGVNPLAFMMMGQAGKA